MVEQPGVWGIDLGQCAFKAIRLEVIDGQVTATAFDYVEHPKILSQPDADPDVLTREVLDKFLERNSLRGDRVAISVPAQSGLARFVKLPPVEEKKINDIVRFEAKQQIPFPLEEVVWDFQKIGSGMVTDGFAMETEIGLFAMKRDLINRYLQHFKDVNVEVDIIQMAPLGLCNFVAYDLLNKDAGGEGDEGAKGPGGKKRAIVALDIGTDNSNLVVTDGEKIIWQRPIPLGGNHFTRALTKDLKLTFAKAEHLKRNAVKSPDLRKILASLKPVLNDFAGEAQRSLGYFAGQHRDAHIEYMVGLGNAFRLPGLQKFLSEHLQLEVKKLQNLERVKGDSVLSVPAFSQNVLSFAVAYGLALQGLKLARLQTNLLPQELVVERMIRAKKPKIVAAAAALLLGTTATMLSYAIQYKAVAGEGVKQATKDALAAKAKIDKDEAEFKKLADEVKASEQALRSVIAGQEERLNWLEVNRFINECLPAPALQAAGTLVKLDANGVTIKVKDSDQERSFGNNVIVVVEGQAKRLKDWMMAVPPPANTPVMVCYQTEEEIKSGYWNDIAQDSLCRYWMTQAGLKGASGDATEEDFKNILKINVEAVDARYFSDLTALWNQLPKNPPPEDKEPPKDGGWLVEIRGYTYHSGKLPMVKQTFLKNLRTKALAKNLPWSLQGTVSHAYIHAYKFPINNDFSKFLLVHESALSKLSGGGGVKSGTGWNPLGGSSGKGTGGPPAGQPDHRPIVGPAPINPVPPPAPPAGNPPEKGRIEFVIFLVWKEPTPSDDRLQTKDPKKPQHTGTQLKPPFGVGVPPRPQVPPK